MSRMFKQLKHTIKVGNKKLMATEVIKSVPVSTKM